MNFCVLKMRRISWLAGEILVSQEGEFFMGFMYVAVVFLPANLIYSHALLITKLIIYTSSLSVCHDVLSTFVCTVLCCIPDESVSKPLILSFVILLMWVHPLTFVTS